MHGGDIYRNDVRYDFSVNVNPLGMPDEMKAAIFGAMEHLGEYPDPESEALRKAISARIGVPAEEIVPGNGASEIFTAAVHALRPDRVLLAAPSFSGYEYAVRAMELPEDAVRYYFLKEEEDFVLGREYLEAVRVFGAEAGGAAAGHKSGITTGEAAGGQKSGITTGEAAGGQEPGAECRGLISLDEHEHAAMAFLACPNNPNGRLIDPEFLKEIIDTCEESGVYLVLDECFLDFADRIYEYRKMLASCEHPHLIRVGAYTKICAIPGVRLGYAMIRDPEIRERIKRQLPEWNISAFAQAAGSSQYDETAWIGKTQEHLRKEREYLQGVLSEPLIRERIRIYPTEANYMMLRTEIPLYEKMLERGILIRDCSDYPGLRKGYYRIAVKTHPENRIFAGTLRGIVFDAKKSASPAKR